jgi:hypothetical protein
MEHPEQQATRGRESFLALMLTAFFGGGFLFFLILVSGGFFFYVLCAVAAVTSLGFLHYVLWGHALTQEVVAEREEQEARERRELKEEGQARREQHGIRRF